jgi:OmcA/MtrC family decaheme c-type cytochrome
LILIGIFVLMVPLLFLGCEGDTGPQGPPGQSAAAGGDIAPGFPAPPASATETAIETCDVCHGPDALLLPMSQFHDAPVIDNVNFLAATITGVTFPATPPITPTVTFTVTLNGAPFTGLAADNTAKGRVDFAIAKLIPGVNGDPDNWRNYINNRRTGTPGFGPGGSPAITDNVSQGTTADGNNDGTLVETATPGTYQFTFTQNLATAETYPGSGVLVGYDPTLTHRVGIQFTPSAPIPTDGRFNAFLDVRPDGNPITVFRRIATTASCLECHTRSVIPPRFGFHGSGARVEVGFCVLCHNPSTIDPESGETVALAVMVHKIHRGRGLPSVVTGGSYAIWGFGNSEHNYSQVGFPQDIRNCSKCHTAADALTPEGDNWMNRPNIQACGSCHDNISFVSPPPAGKVLHTGGIQTSNLNCAVCHPPTGGLAGITDSHAIPGRAAAAVFQFNIVSVDNTAPGQFPRVTFSVTDNTTGTPVAVDILTDDNFTVGGGASRLAVDIGWKTGTVGLGDDAIDWTNQGSGNNVGQPVSINPLASGPTPATNIGGNIFRVTSPVAIPLDAHGTGVAALEGHPALPDGTRLAVRSAFLYFPVTDTTPVARRTVVSVANCDLCHDQLSVHGANRTDSIEVCVICHNPNATDIGRRPYMTDPNAVGIDGKREQTIDFKNMIHALHGSGVAHGGGGSPRTTDLVVYGFGGTPNDFGEVHFPGNIRKCMHCHIDPPGATPPTWQLPLDVGVLAVTVNSPPNLADPDDDGNITKTAGVCSACHDSAALRQHMVLQGANFNVRQGNIIE